MSFYSSPKDMLKSTATIPLNFESIIQTTNILKNAVFWDVAPCRYFVNRRFGGTDRFQRLHQREQVAVELNAHAGSSLVDFLYPEDGGDPFLRNVG
jgi:hypothetical protein